MTTNESWRKYLEAGAAVGQATAARAEDIAKRLFDPDEEERESAWRDLEQLSRFGRVMGEQLAEMARGELTRQLKTFGNGSFEQFFDRIADLFGATAPAPEPPGPIEHEAVLEARVIVVADERAAAPKKPKSKKGPKAKAGASGKSKKKHNKKEKDASGRHDGVLTLTPPLDPAGPS